MYDLLIFERSAGLRVDMRVGKSTYRPPFDAILALWHPSKTLWLLRLLLSRLSLRLMTCLQWHMVR